MPDAAPASRTGARLLVDGLRRHGVDRIFCMPGESFLAVLDVLHDTPEIQVVVCRHEGAGANMAEADAKLTGRPGVCLVTRGPGATHASVGIHTAAQDSTPLVLLVGQVPRPLLGREAFQEMDYRAFFGGMAKWVHQIEEAAAIPEALARAFHVAVSGRPGPVVLSLPEDMQRDTAAVADVPPLERAEAIPSAAQIAELHDLLRSAQRPFVIAGGSGWNEKAREDLARFARAFDLPVAAAFRRQHLFDHQDARFVGHLGPGPSPRLAEHLRSADVIVALG